MMNNQTETVADTQTPHPCTAVARFPVTSENQAAICWFGLESVLADRRQILVETPSYGSISAWEHWERAHP